jgi:hypothetical protein
VSPSGKRNGHSATKSRTVRSRARYWAAVVIILGVGGGLTWGVLSTVRTRDRGEALPRTAIPGTLQVKVESAASELVYFEGNGKPSPAALGLSVTAPDGSSAHLRPYHSPITYEVAGWKGTPVASFSTPTAGTYTIAAKASHEGNVAVGDDFVRTQVISIVGALALIVASMVAGVAVIVAAGKRSAAVEGSRDSHFA